MIHNDLIDNASIVPHDSDLNVSSKKSSDKSCDPLKHDEYMLLVAAGITHSGQMKKYKEIVENSDPTFLFRIELEALYTKYDVNLPDAVTACMNMDELYRKKSGDATNYFDMGSKQIYTYAKAMDSYIDVVSLPYTRPLSEKEKNDKEYGIPPSIEIYQEEGRPFIEMWRAMKEAIYSTRKDAFYQEQKTNLKIIDLMYKNLTTMMKEGTPEHIKANENKKELDRLLANIMSKS